jgi:pyruvate dehydrogenase E1 component alpha subunit
MAHDLPKKAEAYGIEGAVIDGFDALNLYDNLKPLVDACRDEQRPAFVDVKTYRYYGHSMSDPQKYRTKEEVDEFKERDSIANLAAHLMSPKEDGGRGCLSEDELKELQKKTRQVVLEAVEFAEKAADPNPAKELTTDTYALPMKNLSPTDTYRHGAKNPLL